MAASRRCPAPLNVSHSIAASSGQRYITSVSLLLLFFFFWSLHRGVRASDFLGPTLQSEREAAGPIRGRAGDNIRAINRPLAANEKTALVSLTGSLSATLPRKGIRLTLISE